MLKEELLKRIKNQIGVSMITGNSKVYVDKEDLIELVTFYENNKEVE